MEFQEVSLDLLRESPLNPRQHFDQNKIAELAETMKGTVGIIEPLVVRNGSSDGLLEIAGSRRFRAAKLAGLETAPVIKKELSDEQMLEVMVIENNQREDVNALEEAEGYKSLLTRSYTLERLAAKIGRSEKYIYDRLKLLELIPEAQQLLLANKMTPGHAILIARLKPEDQKRAIDIKQVDYSGDKGGLFQPDHGLFDGEELDEKKSGKDPLSKYVGYKPRSVRELGQWIDNHVRFDKKAEIDPMLFPETAATVQDAKDMKLNVVQITHDRYIQPDAKEGNHERIYTEVSWKLADGSSNKAPVCDKWVTGVVVIGPQRGAAYKVCVNKDCDTHWAKERKARERMKSGASTPTRDWKAEQEKRDRERAAFDKKVPAIVVAVVEKIKTAKFGALAQLLTARRFDSRVNRLPKPKDADGLLRVMALNDVLLHCEFFYREHLIKQGKVVGVDVKNILAEKPKPQTSAKMRAGKGYDEPTCVKCHCTELAPCDPPCSWAKLNKKTNAGLCSSCEEKTKVKVKAKNPNSASASTLASRVDSISTPNALGKKAKIKAKAKKATRKKKAK